jgi:hypothetical protein
VTKKLPPNCRRTSKYRRQFFTAEDLSKLRGLGEAMLKLDVLHRDMCSRYRTTQLVGAVKGKHPFQDQQQKQNTLP